MNDENKELYFFDFDKLFENYADKYYNEHEAEYSSPEDFAKRDLDNVLPYVGDVAANLARRNFAVRIF